MDLMGKTAQTKQRRRGVITCDGSGGIENAGKRGRPRRSPAGPGSSPLMDRCCTSAGGIADVDLVRFMRRFFSGRAASPNESCAQV